MSRKDYRLLAKALLDSKPDLPQTSERGQAARVAWNVTVENVTYALAQADSYFQPDRFRKAAGY